MKPGRESHTAVMVCAARAAAHGMPWAAGFSDPTALPLLPEADRARILRFRADQPADRRERFSAAMLRGRARMMVARTLEIDEAVRARPSKQVVILGAGLDGRAWRMPELREAVVFEVDHPDSQRAKRERIGGLTQAAREVRFVPVDFTRDRLEEALAEAGHDPSGKTTWIWEGVVMYLSRTEIEATLEVIRHRSAEGSRLIVAYHSPSWMLGLIGPLLRLVGEPLRSTFRPEAMRELLARYGFAAVRDEDVPGIARQLSQEFRQATRALKHLRVVTASRVELLR